MSAFERIYQTEDGRIELSDQEHLQRVRLSQGMIDAGFVYKPPIGSEMTDELKEKFELAKKITKDTKLVDLRKKDAKSKSKSIKKKTTENHTKTNKPAVARMEKKL